MSTFGQLETGKRGLMAHQTALSTVAHNISNSSTEGYSRQRVRMSPTDPLYAPDLTRPERAGQIGTGVAVTRIERVRDFFIDSKILQSQEKSSYWQVRSRYLARIDQMYRENDGNSVRKVADQFWESWQDLSADPANLDARQQIAYRGQNLMDHINLRFEQLNGLRNQINEEIRIQVNEVNDLANNIGNLNKEILRSLAVGDQPNDLMDMRDLLVEELSQYIDISTDLRDTDEYQVHVGGFRLIQGADVQNFQLRASSESNGYFQVIWPKSSGNTMAEFEPVQFKGGSLKALLDLRDEDLGREITQLDELTMTYVAQVNEIHSSGVGYNGKTGVSFFEVFSETTNPLGNYDSNGDGNFDQTRLYQISGTERLSPTDVLGISGELSLGAPNGTIRVPYNATDTVQSVIERINQSGGDVRARLDRNGNLQLHATAESNFALSYVEDSSYFLTQYSGLMQSQSQEEPGNVFDGGQPDQVWLLRQDTANGGLGAGAAKWQVQLQRNPSASVRVNKAILTDPGTISSAKPSLLAGTVDGRQAPLGNNEIALEIAGLAHRPLMFGGRETMGDFFAGNIAEIGGKEHQADLFRSTFEGELKELQDMRKEVSSVNLDEEFTNMIKFQHGYNAAAKFIATFDKLMDVLMNQVGA
ncbi:flagellar hook-associated protein FlgK [Candidatus Haliotispira prima]|uniref:Flagellar hook-associated protein 1 n=1 Tax=Candidatus Haliotispira prima TaxID=3034016 RepID=A0ABY8MDZ9_9SPIO|nr:flagellar hook-associated protein FlgK [Candidatus Haliotispira prima]